ncbi:MAG TPA: hypothetical protein VFU68_00035 [Terracidiphilus sp.]|nr:hypothetical protein [Terracidiphilus sp.]
MPPIDPSTLPRRVRFEAGASFAPRLPETHQSTADKVFGSFDNQETPSFLRHRSRRIPSPPLRAYLGVFGTTQPIPVGNISSTGFYLKTKESWLPGTNMPLRLERTDKSDKEDPSGLPAVETLSLPSRVVRSDLHGVGFSFVFRDAAETNQKPIAESAGGWLGARWSDRQAVEDLVAELEAAMPGRHGQD